jgi:SAM-dependent methyltransferase
MDKLGPGSDESTVQVLRTLPKASFQTIVDAGCGAGRQTLALARVLGTRIHALDSHRPFLDHLGRRAGEAGLGHLVQMHCMDMKDIPQVFNDIDLLWSEGAAYSIGFHSALESWRAALRGEGFAVLSELSWLRDKAPPSAKTFFESCYPGMRSVGGNAALAEAAGYRLLGTHTLPPEAWTEGYYDVLGPRAESLLGHPDASVRALASETLSEIEIFRQREGSYGYVFYILQRA